MIPIDVSEIQKAEGGVTCCSVLLWLRRRGLIRCWNQAVDHAEGAPVDSGLRRTDDDSLAPADIRPALPAHASFRRKPESTDCLVVHLATAARVAAAVLSARPLSVIPAQAGIHRLPRRGDDL